MTNLQSAILLLLILVGVCVAIYIIIQIVRYVIFLRKELRYVNMEIKRTTGKEREYWLQRRREGRRSDRVRRDWK